MPEIVVRPGFRNFYVSLNSRFGPMEEKLVRGRHILPIRHLFYSVYLDPIPEKEFVESLHFRAREQTLSFGCSVNGLLIDADFHSQIAI